jgi:hypothetical protein
MIKLIHLISASISGFIIGYQYCKYRQMKRDQIVYDECEKISNSLTSHESIERDIDKQLLESQLREKLDKEKILYSDLYKNIKGVN